MNENIVYFIYVHPCGIILFNIKLNRKKLRL